MGRKTASSLISFVPAPDSWEADPICIVSRQMNRFRMERGLDQKQFAALVGVSYGVMNHWLLGHTRPDIGSLPRIAAVLDVTLYDLYDLPDPTCTSTEERRLIAEYRRLSGGHKAALTALSHALLAAEETDRVRPIVALTRVSHSLAAGIGDPIDFQDTGEPIYLYDDPLLRNADAVFPVNGESMEPVYHDRDLVLVERIRDGALAFGEIGAFMAGNEMYIKRYEADGLHSLNPAFPVMTFSESDTVMLIGRVLGVLPTSLIVSPEDAQLWKETHTERRC